MLSKKKFHSTACVWKQRLIDKTDRGGRALNIQQDRSDVGLVDVKWHLLDRELRRNVSRAQAHRLVVAIHAATRVMRRPAGDILEQADGANSTVTAKIKPVQRSLRHANQIACFHFDRHDRSVRGMDVK